MKSIHEALCFKKYHFNAILADFVCLSGLENRVSGFERMNDRFIKHKMGGVVCLHALDFLIPLVFLLY